MGVLDWGKHLLPGEEASNFSDELMLSLTPRKGNYLSLNGVGLLSQSPPHRSKAVVDRLEGGPPDSRLALRYFASAAVGHRPKQPDRFLAPREACWLHRSVLYGWTGESRTYLCCGCRGAGYSNSARGLRWARHVSRKAVCL